MEGNQLSNKVFNATKWSSITEIAAKLVVPITNMILARILAPEEFGVLATIIMIMSFADMFTDAGFQKYLVQRDFINENEKSQYANVAFWTNLSISIFIVLLITVFSDNIASILGSPDLGIVISVASAQLIFTSFSSIQMALFRRKFDFKSLFKVRLIAILSPFFITIPLALLGFGYWSLVIGLLVAQMLKAIILTIKSTWRPSFFYKFSILKKMLSFSIWSMVEAISIWFTVWIDALLIGIFLNEYFLGLYRTSTTMVNSLLAIVTAATVPVIFAALSRLQNNNEAFNNLYFKSQRLIAIFVLPMGVGVFLFSDLAAAILLGDQWEGAAEIIGIWALTSSLTIVFGHYCSEVYRAKGRPKLSFLAQMLHLVVLVPTILISVNYGFWILVLARSLIRLQAILVHFIIMKFSIGIPIFKTIKNVIMPIVSSTIMFLIGYILLEISNALYWKVITLLFCGVSYLFILYLHPQTRKEMKQLSFKLLRR